MCLHFLESLLDVTSKGELVILGKLGLHPFDRAAGVEDAQTR